MCMKKRIAIISGLLCIALIAIVIFVVWCNEQKVSFVDEEMGYVIKHSAYEDGYIEKIEEFRQDDLAKVTDINIGYTGYYTTLADIEKCENLEMLYIGQVLWGNHYYDEDREVPQPENEERVVQLQKELEGILQACPKLTMLDIYNLEGNFELNSLKFLENADNLIGLSLIYMGDLDYTTIWKCSNLVGLSLKGCEISELDGISELQNLRTLILTDTEIAQAGDLLNLPQLKTLYLEGTPLAENEEELQKIMEKFPELDMEY